MRNIILHYHIFKNAGSSVDKLLENSFGNKWTKFDHFSEPSYKMSPNELFEFIKTNKKIDACSSHQARIMSNQNSLNNYNLNLFPIIFLRHPIDRAISAYNFEWLIQMKLQSHYGSIQEYLELKFSDEKNSAIENYQTYYLSNTFLDKVHSNLLYSDKEYLERAYNTLRNLNSFGIVENYETSIDKYYKYLNPIFPNFTKLISNENTSQENSKLGLETKLDNLKRKFGEDIYNYLLQKNNLDIELYYNSLELFHETTIRTKKYYYDILDKSNSLLLNENATDSIAKLIRKIEIFNPKKYQEINNLDDNINLIEHFSKIGFLQKKIFSHTNNYYDLYSKLVDTNNLEVVKKSDYIVIIHLYYEELIDYFIDIVNKYKNIDFVFTVVTTISPYTLNKLFLNGVFIRMDKNIGRDVYPFINSLNFLKNLGYKYICKIHGKKSSKFTKTDKLSFIESGKEWRNDLIQELLGTNTVLEKNMKLIASDDIGMLIPKKYALDYQSFKGQNEKLLSNLMKEMNLDYESDMNFLFSAGSMFWADMNIFKQLLTLEINKFTYIENGKIDGTYAHAIERLFGIISSINGYETKCI